MRVGIMERSDEWKNTRAGFYHQGQSENIGINS